MTCREKARIRERARTRRPEVQRSIRERNAIQCALIKSGDFDEGLLVHHQRAHTHGVSAVGGRGYRHNGHWRHL